jgi:hypothetical protein
MLNTTFLFASRNIVTNSTAIWTMGVRGGTGKTTYLKPSSILGGKYMNLIQRRKNNKYLSIYGSTALMDLGRFFSFLILSQSVGLLGRGISLS